MLAVRRKAPEGSYFADSDRAAGIFGVLATGFSVLLGFLIVVGQDTVWPLWLFWIALGLALVAAAQYVVQARREVRMRSGA